MSKRSTAPAIAAVSVREVDPPPTMAEGYTWCPECQAGFKDDVCPGCSPGIGVVATPGDAVGQTTLAAEGGEPKTLEDVQKTVGAMELDVKTRNTTESLKCVLTDDEKLCYGIAQARANAEIATAEEELQAVKSQYKSASTRPRPTETTWPSGSTTATSSGRSSVRNSGTMAPTSSGSYGRTPTKPFPGAP